MHRLPETVQAGPGLTTEEAPLWHGPDSPGTPRGFEQKSLALAPGTISPNSHGPEEAEQGLHRNSRGAEKGQKGSEGEESRSQASRTPERSLSASSQHPVAPKPSPLHRPPRSPRAPPPFSFRPFPTHHPERSLRSYSVCAYTTRVQRSAKERRERSC